MSGTRELITDPLIWSLAQTTAPPLCFVVSDDVPRRGVHQRLNASAVVQHTPWFSELVLNLRDTTTKVVLYRMAVGEELWLQAACIGAYPEILFNVLAKPDHGDSLAALIQREWPDTFAMLAASTQRSLDRRLLVQVQTASSFQWAVADPVRTGDEWAESPDAVESLMLCAATTALRFAEPMDRLPGLLDVLSGPDQMSRRLRGFSALLSGVNDVANVVGTLASGGIPTVSATVSALRALGELPGALGLVRD
jgi:hypothetical protein